MATHLARAYRATLTEAPAALDPAADPLITAATGCELAGGISRMTQYRWRKAGLIPAPIVIRGRNYYRRSVFLAALDALAAAGSVQEKEAA